MNTKVASIGGTVLSILRKQLKMIACKVADASTILETILVKHPHGFPQLFGSTRPFNE